MNKLKLALDELQVTSFETAAADNGERGTVHGHGPIRYSQQPGCDPFTGPCTGPGCDVTLMISCVGGGCDTTLVEP